MSNKNLIMALVVFASCATFRRAGHGFTDKGTAFATDHFSDEQRKAIDAEPRLSIKELPADALPESVDRAPLDAALAKADAQAPEKVDNKKSTASKTPTKDEGSGSGGDPANEKGKA
jgi:hypothetical protein